MIYAGRFQGRGAVITGGASGLGLEAAKRIVAEGGQVSHQADQEVVEVLRMQHRGLPELGDQRLVAVDQLQH